MSDGEADDEVLRKLLKPKVNEEEALSILVDFYIPDGFDDVRAVELPRAQVLQALDSYDDVNYLVKIDDTKAVLKIHNGVESGQYITAHARKSAKIDEDDRPRNKDVVGLEKSSTGAGSIIDLQTAIFAHLAKPQYNVTTGQTIRPVQKYPSLGRSEDGDDDDTSVCIRELSVVSSAHSPKQLVIRLQRYVEGTPLCSVPWFPIETLLDAGACLGRMCHALDDLASANPGALVASKRYHAWDGRNLLDVRPYIVHIDDSDRRKLVTNVIDEFQKTIIEGKECEKFRWGINHGDFNDGNLIIGSNMKIDGVIDFGDTVYSWRVLDVTTAMAYSLLSSYGKGRRSISAACAILRGFHHKYPLTVDERKHLRLLMMCRLAMSAIIGAYSYKKNPGNEYLLLHSKPAWEALFFIWGMDGKGEGGKIAQVVDNAFTIACDNIHVPAESMYPQFIDISFPDPPIADPFASARLAIKANQPTENSKASKHIVSFVTGNKKKAEEVERILSASGDLPFVLINRKIELPELQGDPILVAKEKCALASREVNGAVITEDTSLSFNALHGMPGIYIKWFLETNGLDGLNDMISFSDDKSGFAQTVVAFCPGPGMEVLTFVGKTMGTIVRPRGSLDFGWDPIFEPNEGNGLTYAEMTGAQKDCISHRKRAFMKLRDFIDQNNIDFSQIID